MGANVEVTVEQEAAPRPDIAALRQQIRELAERKMTTDDMVKRVRDLGTNGMTDAANPQLYLDTDIFIAELEGWGVRVIRTHLLNG